MSRHKGATFRCHGPGKSHPCREVLAQYLDHYRMTIELKCEGVDAAQLATRSVPPSSMSLLGLVRHLARVEHGWWRRTIEGQHGLASTGAPASSAPSGPRSRDDRR